ncbi:hypothetical protein Tco_0898569 [Tanacetum coccineum]
MAEPFFLGLLPEFPISVPLYTGGVLEKDPAPHLTARQEQAVQWLGDGAEVSSGRKWLVKRTHSGGCFLNQTDRKGGNCGEEDVAQRQPEKAKRKKLLKRSDPLPAKRLRTDHPSLASGTGGKLLASLRQSHPEGSFTLGTSSPADIPTHVTVPSSCAADAPVYTAADIVTSSRGKMLVLPTSGVGRSSQPETSEESTDSFYETTILNSEDAKHWYIPRWNITNDSLLDDDFSCRTLVDRSRAEHELDLKRARGKMEHGFLLREKDAEIARLKSLLEEKETESVEVLRLRDQKDTDISLLDSRTHNLKSALDDSQAACGEARSLISSLSFERDGLASEV